jgi:hypothetical protein
METKTPDYFDWLDKEGRLNALEEEQDRERRFGDNPAAYDPGGCVGQSCALTVRLFGKDFDFRDHDGHRRIADQEAENCRGMEWRGRPMTNMEMFLVASIDWRRNRENETLDKWCDGFLEFIKGIDDGQQCTADCGHNGKIEVTG